MSVSAETRIGVGSCFDQAKSPAIWEQIASEGLDGFLFLGDNVYASRHFSEVNLKAAYERASSVIPWDQLGFIHATWDDHDFGRNDGGSDFVGQSISRHFSGIRQVLSATFLTLISVSRCWARNSGHGLNIHSKGQLISES